MFSAVALEAWLSVSIDNTVVRLAETRKKNPAGITVKMSMYIHIPAWIPAGISDKMIGLR